MRAIFLALTSSYHKRKASSDFYLQISFSDCVRTAKQKVSSLRSLIRSVVHCLL